MIKLSLHVRKKIYTGFSDEGVKLCRLNTQETKISRITCYDMLIADFAFNIFLSTINFLNWSSQVGEMQGLYLTFPTPSDTTEAWHHCFHKNPSPSPNRRLENMRDHVSALPCHFKTNVIGVHVRRYIWRWPAMSISAIFNEKVCGILIYVKVCSVLRLCKK